MPGPRDNPRNRGPRGRRIWARSAHPEPSPSGSLVTFWPSRKSLAARTAPAGAFRSATAAPAAALSAEMAAKSPLRETDESEPCPLIRPSVRTGAPSPQGEGFWAAQCAAPTEEGKAFGRPSVPPLRRKGRFSGGEDTAPTEKRMLVGAPVGHSGVPKWAGFPPPPAGRAPLAHNFFKKGHQGPPGGAGSGWPLKKR